jgi:hypothetical protein
LVSTLRISAIVAAQVVWSSAEQIILKQVRSAKMKRKGTPVYPLGEAERKKEK